MKNLIRQWLCDHKKTEFIKSKSTVLSEVVKGKKDLAETQLDYEFWEKCSECGKVIHHFYKA